MPQQEPCLLPAAAAELDDAGSVPRPRADIAAVTRENVCLGACRVVLVEGANPLEQLRSRVIVEILAGNGLGSGSQSGDDIAWRSSWNGLKAETGHETSRARRMPMNCQVTSGGKKLR